MDLSKPTPVWNTLSICPTGLTNNKTTGKKLVSVLGKGIGLSFTVQIAEDASEIALDQPHTVNVQGDEVSVFQFIPPQDISDKQLDITATSQSTVAAYLKVSQNCKEVDVQKDLESINYKKESLRLSFATKGRITLSNFSIPPLMDSVSRWFIGISLKNLSGDVKLSESKNVTLKLTRSFDYNYATPFCALFFVSLVAGTLVSIIAYFLFEESLTQVKPGEGDKFNYNTDSEVLVCERSEETRYHWFSSGPKTHSYIIRILGIVLMIGAFQFVLSYWDTMIQEGNRDKCYYNDFCYKVVNYDIPFNLMISNLTYIVHGLILVGWVLKLDTIVNPCHNSAKTAVKDTAMEERYSFSIAYAIAWALVFQGLLSSLYHLCPDVFTFQFDSAFMFIIAGLIVLLLHDGIEQNRFQNGKYPVDAFDFFLLFIMPLFFLNYLAALHEKVMQEFFYLLLIIWWFGMFIWAFLKLNMHQNFGGNDGEDKFNKFLFVLGGLIIPLVIFWGVFFFGDLAQAPLYACIACSVVAVLAKFRLKKKELFKHKFRQLHGKEILLVIFIALTFIILAMAVFFFIYLPTTNKTLSPENSRDKNEECVILGFFDWHDLWHILSSFGLFMGAIFVMLLSLNLSNARRLIRENNEPKAERKKKSVVQAKTPGNNEPGAQGRKGV